jgi:hypothetical protein
MKGGNCSLFYWRRVYGKMQCALFGDNGRTVNRKKTGLK